MFSPQQILLLAVFPLLFCAVVACLAWRPRLGRNAGEARAPWGWPMAVALGGAILIAGLVSFPLRLPPREAFDWLLFLPAWALVLALVAIPLRRMAVVLLAMGGLVSAWLLLPKPLGGRAGYGALIAGGLAPAVLHVMLRPLTKRNRGPGFVAALLLVALATTCVAWDSTGIQFGQYTVSLVGAAAGLLLACALVPKLDLSGGGLAVFLLIWIGMLLYGDQWADVPRWRTALLAVAPLAAWVVEIPPLRAANGRIRTPVRIAAVAVPALLAAVPAAIELWKLLRSQTEVGEY